MTGCIWVHKRAKSTTGIPSGKRPATIRIADCRNCPRLALLVSLYLQKPPNGNTVYVSKNNFVASISKLFFSKHKHYTNKTMSFPGTSYVYGMDFAGLFRAKEFDRITLFSV